MTRPGDVAAANSTTMQRADFLNQFNETTRRANHPKVCQAALDHNILIFRNSKSVYIDRIPFHSEGRFANVTNVGWAVVGRSGA